MNLYNKMDFSSCALCAWLDFANPVCLYLPGTYAHKNVTDAYLTMLVYRHLLTIAFTWQSSYINTVYI